MRRAAPKSLRVGELFEFTPRRRSRSKVRLRTKRVQHGAVDGGLEYIEVMDDFSWTDTDLVDTQHLTSKDSGAKKYALLIMQAASMGDTCMFEYILPTLQPGHTPLVHSAMCRAASRGHLQTFKTLARYCEDIHADDTRRATNAVISSILGGHYKILDFILAHGGNIDRPTQSGRTALATAVSLGRCDLLELAISRGADVDKPTIDRRTPLCLAATLGRSDLVELLLQHGASVNHGCHCFALGRFDNFHCPLEVAALKGYTKIVSLLLSCGAIFARESDLFLPALVSVLGRGDDTLARDLIKTMLDLDLPLENHFITPLCLAIQRDSLAVARLLTSCGASVHAPSRDGPPLLYAVLKNNAGLVNWLIYSGADVNAYSDIYGFSIHAAIQFGYFSMVRLLLRHGADVNAESPSGPALQIARKEWEVSCTSERQRRFEGIIELLRNAGAWDGESPARSTGIYEAMSICDSGDNSDYEARHDPWFDST